MGQKTAELLDEYAAHNITDRTSLTFMEIERIWAAEILPRLPEFQTMHYQNRTPPPEGPRWRLNYEIPDDPK